MGAGFCCCMGARGVVSPAGSVGSVGNVGNVGHRSAEALETGVRLGVRIGPPADGAPPLFNARDAGAAWHEGATLGAEPGPEDGGAGGAGSNGEARRGVGPAPFG